MMHNRAEIVTTVWQEILTSNFVSDLGEFEAGKIALAYENVEDSDNLPLNKPFVIYNLEFSVSKPAENITQEKTILKFYIGGDESIYVVDKLISLFNGMNLAGCVLSYTGTNTNPKNQNNQIPAHIVRFELI